MQERRQIIRREDVHITVHQCIAKGAIGETWLTVTGLDVSAAGLRISSAQNLESGVNLFILATVVGRDGQGFDFSTDCVVIHSRQTADGLWIAGLIFVDLNSTIKNQLAAVLNS
jgi:hypothetical protein